MKKHLSTDRLRLADALRDRLAASRCEQLGAAGRQLDSLLAQLGRVEASRRRLGLCLDRGWQAAGRRVVEEMRSILPDLPYHTDQARRALEERQEAVLSIRALLAELDQLAEEFGEVICDSRTDTVAVTTEPIELEGVALGAFRIELHVRQIASGSVESAVSVVALDPRPAAGNSAIVHPHVDSGRVCLGDGLLPARAALESGRLSDFCCIVRSVLETYNSGSAYIQLDEWEGVSCHDCGRVVHEEDSYFCTSCEESYCDECASRCERCEDTTCLSCMSPCPVCEDRYCSACLTTCPDCDRQLCRTCEDEQQCPCVEEREELDNEDNEGDRPAIIGQEGQDLPARTEEAGSTAA